MPPQKSNKKKTPRRKPPVKKPPKKPKPSIPKKVIPPQEEKPPEEPKRRISRKKATLESHLDKFDKLLEFVDKEIDRKQREQEKGTRTFQRMRRMIRELKNETPKIANAKRRVRTNGKRVSGFMIKYPVTNECAKFLQIKEGTLLSRREVTNAICVYAHWDPEDTREQMKRWAYLNPDGKRDLQKKGKREILEPDKVLEKLLRYKEYQAQVKAGEVMKTVTIKEPNGNSKRIREVQEDDALYYRVIQKLIDHLFVKPKKTSK